MITNMLQQRISKMRRGAVSAALMLVVGLGLVVTQSAQAQTFTLLHSFTGAPDGAYPFGGVAQDTAGNLYGTTSWGGSSYFGDVFKVDTSGTETVLYDFSGATDGANPDAGLIFDAAGNLYGTTYNGGAYTYGAVFVVDSSGAETVVHSFNANLTDGQYPYGGLVRDGKGNLYGTTQQGGIHNLGTVFKVGASGKEKVLHVFAGGEKDGEYPDLTSLLMDAEGNLYGVTYGGGHSNCGVVYKLSRSGKFTVLHSFLGGANDGCDPYGTPAMDAGGNLYGTTEQGGPGEGEGIVWKLSKTGGKWTETLLHNFAGGSSDGAYPLAGVILDAQDNLYGDTANGGASNVGTVYELSLSGTLTVLHSFAGSDGEYPYGGVILDSSGNLYGTTEGGGSGGFGTVWQITP